MAKKEFCNIWFIILSFILLVGCSLTNSSPIIQSISANPESLTIGESCQLTCIANDDDGDILSFKWTCSEGNFSSGTIGESVIWNAPIESSSAVITTIVSDGKDEVQESINITVSDLPSGEKIFLDSRDSHYYRYKTFGSQKWMTENLAYLPSISSSSLPASTSEERYYVYDYFGSSLAEAKNSPNYKIYGALYNWTAAMNNAESSTSNPSGVKGICPVGWHLPSDGEWSELILWLTMEGYGYSGFDSDVAKSMASNSMWNTSTFQGDVGNNQATNNTSGFTALPSGIRGTDEFSSMGWSTNFWTSREKGIYAICRYITCESDHVYETGRQKKLGYSVRCIKND